MSEFKVGDRVVFVSSPYAHKDLTGLIATVRMVVDDGKIVVFESATHKDFTLTSRLRKATPLDEALA